MFTTDLYGKSVYRNDYKGKQGERVSLAEFQSDYSDPAAGPFLHYLLPEAQKHNLPRLTKFEHHDAAIERAVIQIPALRNRLTGKPLDMDIINQIYLDRYRSEYSQKICGPRKTLAETFKLPFVPNGRVVLKLPDGWPEPSSTYRDSFRGPVFGPNPVLLHPVGPIVHPKDNLPFLKTSATGFSEYQAVIGKLGGLNISDHYHGQRKPRNLEEENGV